jgi:hypothetical protein
MSDLSPAAQAVLDAAYRRIDDNPFNEVEATLAAALRAAAEIVASPEQADPHRQWDLGFVAACAAIYGDILAIADELEAQ